MKMQGVPAHRGCPYRMLLLWETLWCIQGAPVVKIVELACQFCVLGELDRRLTKGGMMQVRGERHCQSGMRVRGWKSWCDIGQDSIGVWGDIRE